MPCHNQSLTREAQPGGDATHGPKRARPATDEHYCVSDSVSTDRGRPTVPHHRGSSTDSPWACCPCSSRYARHLVPGAQSDFCLCLSVSLSLCLCQTNLHMRDAMRAPPARQKQKRALLCKRQRRLSSMSFCNLGTQRSQVCVCLRTQQHSLQLSSPSPNSMRAAPSIGRHRHHQFTQQLGAFIAQSSISLEDQRPHGGSITFRFSDSPATVAAHGFDALSL